MMETSSISSLLKQHKSGLSAVKVNKILVDLGLLEERERSSTKYQGKVKKFKVLTEEGLVYGVNVENPNSPGQTAPQYFNDAFDQLLALVTTWVKAQGGSGDLPGK